MAVRMVFCVSVEGRMGIVMASHETYAGSCDEGDCQIHIRGC